VSEITGGCLCGAVRYRLTEPLSRAHLCHCRICQRATGSAFSSDAGVPVSALVFSQGAPKEYRSSPRATRGFCAACGTPLTFRYDGADWIGISLGSLDRPEALTLEFHYGVESRLPWLAFADGLPQLSAEENPAACGCADPAD